jgi:hypothetical protein
MAYTIADRAGRVILMLGGRSDLQTRVEAWLRDSYIDLGTSYDFEELEETVDVSLDGNNYNNNYTYPQYNDGNNNWDTRAVKSLLMLESNNQNNNQVIQLTKKPISFFDRIPDSVGTPAIWVPYKRRILLKPRPENDYDGWLLRCRVWLKPLIESGNNMNNTTILLPDDWLEILEYAAALRGHTELLERDKAAEVLQLLHGSEDPRKGRRVPGLIEMKLTQRQAEARYDDWGMRPRTRRYTR